MALVPGQEFGHFAIVRKIGEGGMGQVFLAEDRKLHRQVALKILPAEVRDHPDRLERFTREAQTAARISHPAVMSIYDLDVVRDDETDTELNFIAMEYVSGRSLTVYLEEELPSLGELLRIAEKITTGLSAAHRLDIVHRDIKPDNIKIDDNGDPKILDFGLAKAVEYAALNTDPDSTDTISRELTQDGRILGTVNYMSPEQARGESIDTRSDIFSFGVLLYRMFTGRQPFEGPDKVSVLARVLESKQAPLRKHNESIPAELERIVDKCLQKLSGDRYQDTRDLVVDLRALRRQFDSGISDSDSFRSGAETTTKRPRGVVIGVGAALFVLAAIVIGLLIDQDIWQADPVSASENRLAVMSFENLADPTDSLRLGKIIANLLIADLSESKFIDVVSSQRLHDILRLLGEEDAGKLSKSLASQVAKRANARWMLQGSILQVEPNIIFTAQLVEVATGDAITSQRITGEPGEKIFTLVDRLTVDVKQNLALPDAALDERDPRVAAMTTESADAYRYYLEGRDYLWKLMPDLAWKSFDRSLAIDSTFALAHYGKSMCTAPRAELQAAIDQAMKYLDNATNIDQLYIRSQHARLHGDIDSSASLLTAIVTRHPDEKNAWYRLGNLYWVEKHNNEIAIEMFLKAIDIDPLFKIVYNELAYLYHYTEQFEQSIWAINKYIELAPDEPNPYDSRGDLYAYNGRVDDALESYQKAVEIDSSFYFSLFKLGNMHRFKREYDEAERVYRVLALKANKQWRSLGRAALATIPMQQGKFEAALEVLQDAIGADNLESEDIAANDYAFKYQLMAAIYFERDEYEKALESVREATQAINARFKDYPRADRTFEIMLLARLGRIEEAEAVAEEFVRNIKTNRPRFEFLIPTADMALAYGRGDTAAALTALERAWDEIPEKSFELKYIAAKTYLATGRRGEAVTMLEEAMKRFDESRANSPIFLVKAHYLLGRAYEESGWNHKAREQYKQFLELWDNADPGLESIADARSRLAAIDGTT